jgi:hypothetical protein
MSDKHPAVKRGGDVDVMLVIPRKIPTDNARAVHNTTAVINMFRIVIAGFGGSKDALIPDDAAESTNIDIYYT